MGDELPRIIPLVAGGRERDLREGAETQHVLLAAETIPKPPKLFAVGVDQKMQAVAVGERVRLPARFCVLDGEQSESHEYTTSLCERAVYSIVYSAYPTVTGRHDARRARDIAQVV